MLIKNLLYVMTKVLYKVQTTNENKDIMIVRNVEEIVHVHVHVKQGRVY